MPDIPEQLPCNRHAAPSFLPTVAVLEMTYKCNHQCLFCSCPWFAPGSTFEEKPELTIDQWKKLITGLCARGVCYIAFTGGEPLLKQGIEEIIKHAAKCTALHIDSKKNKKNRPTFKKAPPKLYLLTNGLSMNHEILKFCKRYKVNLSMSLPGLKTFRYHTGRDGAIRVLSWFEEARKIKVNTTVGVTVTAKNLFELYETISAAFIAGADTLLMNRFLPGGRGMKHAEQLMINREQITQMLDTAEDVLETANRTGSVGTELPKCLIDTEKYTRLSVGTRCSAAIDFFVVDPSGYFRVCNHSPVRLTHFTEIEQLKSNPYWKRFIKKDYLPAACGECEQLTDCDGGCREAAHIVGKALDAEDPVFMP
jgi:radical SAM protein with 4Fe4S-binding SPASM domain